jgi:hypothetical protein
MAPRLRRHSVYLDRKIFDERIARPQSPLLRIVGAGDREHQVREAASLLDNVEYLGLRGSGEVLDGIGSAMALIFPITLV